jgi:hypothetical protein
VENLKMKPWQTFLSIIVACITIVTFLQAPLTKRQDNLEKGQDTLSQKIEVLTLRLADSREVLMRIDGQVTSIRQQLEAISRQTKMSASNMPTPSPLSRGYTASMNPQ